MKPGRSDLKKMLDWLLSRLPFYFVFFILPVLVMSSCEGWNTGTMTTQRCAVDLAIVRSYADGYYTFVTFSSFLLAIPILVYILVLVFVSEILGKGLKNLVG